MLKKYDPEYYKIVDKNNSRRIIRALEVSLSLATLHIIFKKSEKK